MQYWNRGVDGLIARALKGAASEEEREFLRSWRRDSTANEHYYRELVRLLMEVEDVIWDEVADSPPPRARQVIMAADGASSAISPRASSFDRKRWAVRVGAAALGVVSAAAATAFIGVALFPSGGDTPVGVSLGPREIATVQGETSIVRLGDGTVVRLAPESRLRIPEMPAADGARQVWLSGRAFFAVAEDNAGRPFVIRSHAGDAAVLGTRFDLTVSDDDLRVLVVDGTVKLSAQGAPSNGIEVGASQLGYVSTSQAPIRDDVDESYLEKELEWLGNFLVFEATSLKQAAHELSRRYGVPVQILDPRLETETVRGLFVNETLEDVVEIICRTLSVHCVTRTSGVTIGL